MEINALLMDTKDNVATCVAEVPAGNLVVYRCGEELCSIMAKETIPYCHKIALTNLNEGDEVIKYGELIGKTSRFVGKGDWVSHNNIYSIPRDYEKEFVK